MAAEKVVPGSVSTTSSTPAYSTAFDGAFDVPLTTSTSTFSPHRSPIRFEDCIPWMSPITTPCKRRYSYRKNRLLNTSSEDDDSVASPPISPVHHLQKRLYSQVLAGTASLSLTPPLHQRAGTILDVDLVAIDRQSQPGLDVSSSGSQADNKRTTKRLSKAEKKKLANQRKAKAMQLKRENEAAKLAERERNADAKRRKRETESFRQSEAERDAVARRRARLDKLRRQQEAERDREAKRIGRLDAERRQQEAERDREAKRIGRLDAERRQQETDRDREAKRIARLDAERRQQETDRDREAKRIARLDAERRQQEADRDRDAKRIGRLDAERRQQETDRDREAKRIARLDAERRQQGAERSREAMRFARLDEERRQQEAERDREAKRIARLDEERRQQEAKRDREAKRITRGNVHNREQEAARDCTARQLRRQDPAARQHEHVLRSVRGAERNTFPVMEAEFRKKCKEGPTHICCCCGQLWFKASITIWSEEQIAEKVHVDGWSDACGVQRSSGDPYTLCGTCKKYFTQEKRIPPLALINGLRFPDVPPALQGLRPLEERLVSPRIPFMQIRELGVCRQYGIRGSCVNVPVDINRAVSALPRHLGNVQTVFVKLVRRMRDTHAYASDHVRLPIVFEAARYLINTPLFIQYGVTLDENWLEQVQIELDQLQQDLDREDDGENPDDPGEHEDDAGWEDVNEEDEMLADQETLLDDVDIISPDTGISIAPGENRMPTSLLFDKHVEELSFPTIYCGLARNVASSVSITQIAKAEARMFDRRCAANIPKLFLSFCRLRRHKIAAQVTLALRKKRGGPFKDYKMWHHFFRVEMQHRGSMHFHCILWLEGAPLFNPANPESEEECAGFIDELITCMLDQDMGELLNVQFHRHSRTCRRQVGGRRVCRFGVPFSPMRRTRILLPFEESVPDDVRKQLSAEYHSLQQRILALHKETPDISFDEFLEAIGMEEEHYIAVVRSQSEVSAQEASLHILGLSMAEASVADIYINTSPPEERVRLQKAAAELRRIFEEDPGSTDIFAAGLLEHYVQRPDDLEQCCLAEFAAIANAAAAQDVCVEEENEDDVEVNEEDETRPPPPIAECLVAVAQKDLQLKDKSGYVSRRAPDKEGRDNPKVIRYRNYSPATDPDNFMREQLMLFSHWRDENTLVSNTRGLYEANLDVVKANRAKYVKLDINMEEVLEEVMRREERDEDGDNELDNAVPEDFRVFEADNDHNADIGLDVAPDILNVNAPLSERFLLPHHIPENDYLALVACLNERQRRYHLNIVHILKTRPDEQVLHFVTGGAGVGKSALIKAITQSAIRIFVKMFQENPNHLTVAIMAPTGKAAFGVGGVTIASALKIFTENPTMTLGPDELNTLRTQLAHVRLIIIDEVSMVGREMCAQIDKRLKQIFNSLEPFGGS
ncbi:ATP-dependent DNA helicase RRM3 [Frankliniella fusca]|uniref:ATP-dependent DNA helicase n=1 Tax=Frankliniella fusca TaxID=407009 RepID=A0AAE1L6L5_9NEOP|nr:ATP-dependent DNA helicase RRM3 [Frankliniella fusca]